MSILIKYKDKDSFEEIYNTLTDFGYTLKYDRRIDLPTTITICKSEKFVTCLCKYQSVLIKDDGTLKTYTDLD